MNKKTVVLGVLISLMISSYAQATDEQKHHDQDISMMGDMKESSAEAVEVGNKICPVSGEEVAAMDTAIKYEYNGKVYNLCCSGCVEIFKENPQEYSDIAEQEAR